MKPKQIEFEFRESANSRNLLRYQEGIGHYVDYDHAKNEFKERFALSIAKRILNNWDDLVEYSNYKEDGIFYQRARVTIMGDDVEYKNDMAE